MSTYSCVVEWQRHDAQFEARKFSRVHEWQFDGGVNVPASPSPQAVRAPMSSEAAVDPEEALLAALASCHMLFFLAFAAKQGLSVETYRDEPTGSLGEVAPGRTGFTTIRLAPKVRCSGGQQPSAEQLAELHKLAHQHCYIANSLNVPVTIE